MHFADLLLRSYEAKLLLGGGEQEFVANIQIEPMCEIAHEPLSFSYQSAEKVILVHETALLIDPALMRLHHVFGAF
jgi:hypothetical protein